MNKKNTFVTIGLILVGLLIFVGKNSSIYAAAKEGSKFEDWIVVCEKDESEKNKGKKVCYLSQSLSKDDKKVAEFKVGYFGNESKLQMIQVLPLGVNVGVGSAIIADKELIAPGKFVTCYNYGCLAVADLKEADMKKLCDAKETFIGLFIADANKQVNLKFSTKGLKKGLEALK